MSRVYKGLWRVEVTLTGGAKVKTRAMTYEDCEVYCWSLVHAEGVERSKIILYTKRDSIKWIKSI